MSAPVNSARAQRPRIWNPETRRSVYADSPVGRRVLRRQLQQNSILDDAETDASTADLARTLHRTTEYFHLATESDDEMRERLGEDVFVAYLRDDEVAVLSEGSREELQLLEQRLRERQRNAAAASRDIVHSQDAEYDLAAASDARLMREAEARDAAQLREEQLRTALQDVEDTEMSLRRDVERGDVCMDTAWPMIAELREKKRKLWHDIHL